MTHKIAIITTREYCSGEYEDSSNEVVHSITDWTEVSDEDFALLSKAQYSMPYDKQFRILEQPVDTPAFIAKTTADYILIAKKKLEDEENAKKKRAEDALARKIKKELKDKSSKLKMLQKLRDELGDEALEILAKPV